MQHRPVRQLPTWIIQTPTTHFLRSSWMKKVLGLNSNLLLCDVFFKCYIPVLSIEDVCGIILVLNKNFRDKIESQDMFQLMLKVLGQSCGSQFPQTFNVNLKPGCFASALSDIFKSGFQSIHQFVFDVDTYYLKKTNWELFRIDKLIQNGHYPFLIKQLNQV